MMMMMMMIGNIKELKIKETQKYIYIIIVKYSATSLKSNLHIAKYFIA